jgi:hypothetical protein
MRVFYADTEHAMCNIQNRTIPVLQLTQLRKLSNENFQGMCVIKRLQQCQVLQLKMPARALEVPVRKCELHWKL